MQRTFPLPIILLTVTAIALIAVGLHALVSVKIVYVWERKEVMIGEELGCFGKMKTVLLKNGTLEVLREEHFFGKTVYIPSLITHDSLPLYINSVCRIDDYDNTTIEYSARKLETIINTQEFYELLITAVAGHIVVPTMSTRKEKIMFVLVLAVSAVTLTCVLILCPEAMLFSYIYAVFNWVLSLRSING